MRVYNTDYLHCKLTKQILLAESYTETKGLEFIIKSCRLKPYEYLFSKKNNNIILYRWWIDEFGNSLIINEDKKINITFNDLKLNRKKIVCTDLYSGLSISKILKISKLLFIYSGKDEDLGNEFAMLGCLGIDGYLRCFMCLYGEWTNISPLYLGINNLLKIYNNLDVKFIINNKNTMMPCADGQSWISSLPMQENFLSLIDKETNIIVPKLIERN
jgi:hypothetical protein